jgi:hypothetical protein
MLDKSFTGGLEYLNESLKVSLDAAEEDQSEEIESLLNGLEVDDQLKDGILREPGEESSSNLKDNTSKRPRMAATIADNDQLSINLKNASAGVVVDTTLSDYGRQVPLQEVGVFWVLRIWPM